MCGIFGVFGFRNNSLEKARAALTSLTHRGPDQSGEWYEPEIYLGHRRLSIIDLSENAKQPMVDHDNSVGLSVNG
jgi:asparagine synthase (glutamine-hydrolysing)